MTERSAGAQRPSRREVVLGGIAGLAAGATAPAAVAFPGAAGERILVVVELAGGNDGLDTVIPYGDDAYHRARPTLRTAARGALRLDHQRALHPALDGLRRLWSDGRVAIVEGCGHPGASRGHFAAMALWHTASTPETDATDARLGAELGWLGRLADHHWSDQRPVTFVNVATTLSPALRSRRHATVLFSDPERSVRCCRSGARLAAPWGERVRATIRGYRTRVEYGRDSLATGLRAVAALIESGLGARGYYLALGGFDTHAAQNAARPPLLARLDHALHAFHQDLRRWGRGGDVVTLLFSEFGRRLEENAHGGTEHGTAGPVLLIGDGVAPGIHGAAPSLTELDDGGDLRPSTDFRRIYAGIERQWLGTGATVAPLGHGGSGRAGPGAGSEPLRLFS